MHIINVWWSCLWQCLHCLAGGIYTANSKSPFSLAAAPFFPPVLHKTRRTRLYFAIYFPPLLPLSLFFLLSSSESEHHSVYKRRERALRTTTGHPPFSGLADHCFSKVCLSIRYTILWKNLFSLNSLSVSHKWVGTGTNISLSPVLSMMYVCRGLLIFIHFKRPGFVIWVFCKQPSPNVPCYVAGNWYKWPSLCCGHCSEVNKWICAFNIIGVWPFWTIGHLPWNVRALSRIMCWNHANCFTQLHVIYRAGRLLESCCRCIPALFLDCGVTNRAR